MNIYAGIRTRLYCSYPLRYRKVSKEELSELSELLLDIPLLRSRKVKVGNISSRITHRASRYAVSP